MKKEKGKGKKEKSGKKMRKFALKTERFCGIFNK
jgi:hypothetical protein